MLTFLFIGNMSTKILLLITILSYTPVLLHGRHLSGRSHLKFDKLFAFGDSYADTGNEARSAGRSWKQPYGSTFPGKPSGRFSNGRIFTDFIAEFMGIPTPIPHKYRGVALKRQLNRGMNFAYGGTGVFETELGGPNMTYQIDEFERLVKLGVFTAEDLQSSVAVVSLAGNDYSTHMDKYPDTDFDGWMAYINKVVTQLKVNLKRIRSLGVKRVGVNTLPPLGCVPDITYISSYKECNETIGGLSTVHLLDLTDAVAKLNSGEKEPAYFILDIGSAMMDTLGQAQGSTPDPQFPDPLRPCCEAKDGSLCGLVDANGEKLYTTCEDPASFFFWDSVHPTQAGWNATFMAIQSDVKNFLN